MRRLFRIPPGGHSDLGERKITDDIKVEGPAIRLERRGERRGWDR